MRLAMSLHHPPTAALPIGSVPVSPLARSKRTALRAGTALLAATALLLLLGAPRAGQAADRPVELRLEAGSDGRIAATVDVVPLGEIEIVLAEGRLRVVGIDRSELRIEGRCGRDLDGLFLERVGRYSRLEARAPAGPPPLAPGAAPAELACELEVEVPAGTDLRLRTMAAAVRLEQIEGRTNVETIAGAVRISGAPRSIEVSTITGPVTLDARTPEATVRGVSGPVVVDGEIEVLRAETVDGELRAGALVGVEGFLSTVTGSLHFTGRLASTARLRARVSSGTLRLALEPDSPASLALETVSGTLFDRRSAGPAAGSATLGAATLGDATLGDDAGGRHRLSLPGRGAGGESAPRVELFSIEGDLVLETLDPSEGSSP